MPASSRCLRASSYARSYADLLVRADSPSCRRRRSRPSSGSGIARGDRVVLGRVVVAVGAAAEVVAQAEAVAELVQLRLAVEQAVERRTRAARAASRRACSRTTAPSCRCTRWACRRWRARACPRARACSRMRSWTSLRNGESASSMLLVDVGVRSLRGTSPSSAAPSISASAISRRSSALPTSCSRRSLKIVGAALGALQPLDALHRASPCGCRSRPRLAGVALRGALSIATLKSMRGRAGRSTRPRLSK